MDRVRATLRVKRYSPRTQKTYCYWIRYFIRFYRVRNPASIGAFEVKSPDKSGSWYGLTRQGFGCLCCL
ncbi:phage integrase N-terminal SAM-like domain-containing protein [Halomonas mongoliensis]|uniref:phage integrase N-terminal SAM-like domain-containing protein n=1 Tax=Halomonas mongoliensis TaxID=321265 RepID=UPI00403B04C5